MDEVIRFEQALFQIENENKAELYKERFQMILGEFSRSPLLQMVGWDIWSTCLDSLMKPYQDGDYSKFLFDESDKMFTAFEELQKDNEDVRQILIEAIQRANKKKGK